MIKQIQKHLQTDENGKPIPRLIADGKRLFSRIASFHEMSLTSKTPNMELLEIACYALQLPQRQISQIAGARFGQLSLKQRCEQASELLVTLLGEHSDDKKLDLITSILSDVPAKSPRSDEAKLLADAINLDDFGLVGLLNTTTSMALAGQGIDALIDGARKRDVYGYWESRLRDGFHYNPIRLIAEKRLGAARRWLEKIDAELNEDQPQ